MKTTKTDLIVLVTIIGLFTMSILGCLTIKKVTHGNGSIETEKLIKKRIK